MYFSTLFQMCPYSLIRDSFTAALAHAYSLKKFTDWTQKSMSLNKSQTRPAADV